MIAFVNGESVFGNLRFTTFLTIEPSESTTTKYKDAVVVKFSVGFSFGVVTVDWGFSVFVFSVVFVGSLVSVIVVSFLETSSCEGISVSEEVANSSEVSVCSDFSDVFGGVCYL